MLREIRVTIPSLSDRGVGTIPSTKVVVGVTSLRFEDGDAALIAAAQRGERTALDLLVRRHDRWVRGVVYSTLGHPGGLEDVVQQVWTNVWQQIGTLVDPAAWKSWLYRLARNAAIDFGQKARRDRKLFAVLPAEAEVADGAERPAVQLIAAEEHSRVLRAIQSLPAIYREPFVLRHLEDWSYAQIGEALDLPIDTVETRLVRARRLLREMLNTEQQSQ